MRLLALVLIAIIPTSAILLLLGLEQRQAGARKAQRDALQLARGLAAEEGEFVAATRTLLSALARVPAVREREPGACDDILAQIQADEPLQPARP